MTLPEEKSHQVDQLSKNLRKLIDQTFDEDEIPWERWIAPLSGTLANRCWELKGCGQTKCSAYGNAKVRCWLLAGTMCGGVTQGIFAKKYRSCSECEVFRMAVYADPIKEVEEQIVILAHNLKVQREQIKVLATTDYLTGLYNRRFFEAFIELEANKIARKRGAICLILIDVDNFKKINDEFGHVTGDEVLKECAGIISESIRKSDVLIRFGGDEFLVAASFLPHEENPCDDILRRMAEGMARHNQNSHANGVALSISSGHALLAENRSLDEVIHEADLNMYENKRMRRGLGANFRAK